ncbi:hypothetical protein HMPREF1556_01465 [Porphyromonas sp. oral taxon 278 str. W7784]|nr:hypothetical protein HMPREF1556_01465 [Porphyromonas sp. oral taxon 278 str. W7784]
MDRFDDLPWVVKATYSRFFLRPTVGHFLASLWEGEKGAVDPAW